jgi:hypothetical protein
MTTRLQITEIAFALVGAEDLAALPSTAVYSLDKDGYAVGNFYSEELRKGVRFLVHRWVMREPEGLVVDHINGNRLDNRKSNLRACTVAQNSQNRRKPVKNYAGGAPTSKFKGVYRRRQKPTKWYAAIRVAGRSQFLGSFDTETEAARAYNMAATEAWGEYAGLNIVS